MKDSTAGEQLFGLIGRNIGYSFSQKYFSDKFSQLGFSNFKYRNFDIQEIAELNEILAQNPQLIGLNVTIPFKEAVIPYLDEVSEIAAKIGAVNTISITPQKKLKGYNTDWIGFKNALQPLLQPHHQRALILGTGGAAKAIRYALEYLGIPYSVVSRRSNEEAMHYEAISKGLFASHQIVINCTPLGTFPDVELAPPIQYEWFTDKHIAFDLIYNPEKTEFLKRAATNGATTQNGYQMLVYQAEMAWKIWNGQTSEM